MSKKQIVILGGGFAGIYSALSILEHAGTEAEITVISKHNYFLFTPMLHEVATGGLGHHQVVESIREIIRKTPIRFFEATVASVDLSKKEAVTDHGSFSYDYLIVALGATTNFFDTKGAAEHALVLKDLQGAIKLRSTIIERFEAASRTTDPEKRREMLSFVIVGGGATGVELAAEISEFTKRTLHKYYRRQFSENCTRITLVQSAPELLPSFGPETRSRAHKSRIKKGVSVILSTKVNEVRKDAVVLAGGASVPAGTVVWTAGVRPNMLETAGGEFAKDSSSRIITDSAFRVKGAAHVYALGDIAHVENASERAYPMLAQVAVAEAKHLGKNIARTMHGKPELPFVFKAEGELVSLGQWEAAGTIGKLNLYGKLAWFIWRTVYLFKFISRSKKLKIAVDWTIHLFFPRDVTRI